MLFWFFLLFVGLVGFGNGIFMVFNNLIVMSLVVVKDLGVVGGINVLVCELGMIVGILVVMIVLYLVMS